jgi:hypothetical protein
MTDEINLLTDEADGGLGDPLEVFVSGLNKTLDAVVMQRADKEQEWLKNLRQYKGVYPPNFEFPEGGSKVFTNITKPKTKAGAAQLIDMLFPADDRNYGILPTPDPELADAVDNKEQVVNHQGQPMQFADTKEPFTKGDAAKVAMERADEAAKNMLRVIDDQLVECHYNGESRKAIYSAAILGTGVLCGPEVEFNEVRAYKKNPQTGVFDLVFTPNKKPIVRFVPLWDFFPDMAAASIQECNYVFERSYMSKKTLKDLRRVPNIHKENLKKLLKDVDPKQTQRISSHVSELRELSGIVSMVEDSRYEVWRYRGPIKTDVLIATGALKEEDREKLDAEYDGILIFCGGFALKAAVNPMETEDWPYSVFCWEYDDHCIFGTGIPHDAEQQQSVINTAVRLMLDNATRSAGPQIVINRKLAPQNGSHVITPWKIWESTDANMKVSEAFQIFNFSSHQTEIANIYNLAKAQIDETTGLPMIQQGEQGQITPTVGGMSMLMNASTTVRRSQVKQWDDFITVPIITRLYDWNMQYNPDESIKGDLKVYARGTSALLVKEQQAQTLITFLDKYAGHPVLSQFLKNQGLDAIRKAFEALHINPDDVLKTMEEYETELVKAQEAAQNGEQEPEYPRIVAERMRGENRLKEIQEEHAMRVEDNRLQYAIAEMKMNTEAMRIASAEKISFSTVMARLKESGMKLDLDASKFKTELQVKQSLGKTGNFGME